jgi:hypothetical protein
MATFYATKDPNSDLDYAINWGDWLVGTDTISTSTWTGPTDLTIYGDSMEPQQPQPGFQAVLPVRCIQ